MDPRAESLTSKRLRLLARGCLFWGLLILARLIDLQVIDHEKYRNLAQRQHDRNVALRAPRGNITDRNGRTLAMSDSLDSVVVNPGRISDAGIAAELLARVLKLDQAQLSARIHAAIETRNGFLWVKRKITPEEMQKLKSFKLGWVEFRQESTRYYPNGQLAAHVLGGVDHEEKGNAGIELSLNADLQGKAGSMQTSSDPRHYIFDSKVFLKATPGANVQLTIDQRIQWIAEKALAAAVKEHGAKTGSLVVMDPKTGHILAMANYPSFDPNLPPEAGDGMKNRQNLAVVAPFEPGSVFKVITLATALETTRLTPASSFHCGNGRMTLFRRVIRDAHPNGHLTMAEILAKSSNIGAIKIALEVGSAKLHEFVRKFGFGSKTGVPLPGEQRGTVHRLSRWIPSSIGSVAMGHEVSTTTLQLAQACSVIANGGFLVKPKLVIGKERNGLVEKESPVTPERVLRPEIANTMRMMMERVVLQGTGKRARLDGYTSGGKTGSAQIFDAKANVYTHRYNGSYIGFAPLNNPAIVVVVTLNETPTGDRGFGGRVAAPVFREVAGAALRLLEVQRDLPDDPGVPPQDMEGDEDDLAIAGLSVPPSEDELIGPDLPPQLVPDGPKVPDFAGMSQRDVLSASVSQGLRVEIAGSGLARSQYPRAGVVLRPGERVRVLFAR